MKLCAVIVSLVLSICLHAHAGWLGEPFDNCLLTKPNFPPGKTVEVTAKVGPFTLYQIKFGDFDYCVFATVSNKTNRIVKLSMTNYFSGIYDALAFASTLCDGTAELPNKATKGHFEIKVSPGGNLEHETISISLTPSAKGRFSLDAELKTLEE